MVSNINKRIHLETNFTNFLKIMLVFKYILKCVENLFRQRELKSVTTLTKNAQTDVYIFISVSVSGARP